MKLILTNGQGQTLHEHDSPSTRTLSRAPDIVEWGDMLFVITTQTPNDREVIYRRGYRMKL